MPEPTTAIVVGPAPKDFNRWDALLELIHEAYAYMDPLIDPPSSAYRLTEEGVRQKAEEQHLFLAQSGTSLVGCGFFAETEQGLYVGKLAVPTRYQQHGIGRRLVSEAEILARQLGYGTLWLETRIELVGNHQAFGRLGFVKTGEHAHKGFDRPTFITMEKVL